MGNLVIENMATTHDKGIRNGFKFTITLKQIRVTELQYVDLARVAIPARPKKNAGKQAKAKKAKKAESTAAAESKLDAWIKAG